MTALRDRLLSWFVAPPPAPGGLAAGRPGGARGDAPGGRPTAVERDVAVVCRPPDAAVSGAAVGLALRARAAVVALWGAQAPVLRAPPAPAARRRALHLAARGHDAVATGRLVYVTLATGPDEALRARAAAAAPVVTVLAAARDERADAVLRDHDRTIAVGDGPVAELAATSLARAGIPVRTLALPDAPVARHLTALGLALVDPLRPAVLEALR
jgi:hypothetical protein